MMHSEILIKYPNNGIKCVVNFEEPTTYHAEVEFINPETNLVIFKVFQFSHTNEVFAVMKLLDELQNSTYTERLEQMYRRLGVKLKYKELFIQPHFREKFNKLNDLPQPK